MTDEMPQREAYGRALADYGELNPRLVVLDADTSSSTLTHFFANKYPQRFFNLGIAEPCMVDVGVGLALEGWVPFVNAFAAFLCLRAAEQVRTCVAYAETAVRLVGHYAGLSDFKDGATHHCITDLAVMRALPNMTVIVPADNNEIRRWVSVLGEYDRPVYLRISRAHSLPVHSPNVDVQIGKAITLQEGGDVSIFATGAMTGRSLLAVERLAQRGISARLIEIHTLKPIDAEAVCLAAAETGAVVTAEEHSIFGGLGSAIAEVLAENCPVPVERVGIADSFAPTALDPESLMDYMGLGVEHIVHAAEKVLRKKEACVFSKPLSAA
ncbi:MAG: transketolase family protein [Anaerolineae bacterium]|nr:transketolase family protein [Anaerolineae bacterium]